MTEWITQFILFFKDLSYAGLVIALSFEFVPAELVLPMAGYWVYLGDMKLWLAILAGTVGGTFGPLTLYALGRYGGRPMVEKYGKYFLIRPHHVDASDKFLKNTAAGSLSMAARTRHSNGHLHPLRYGKDERFQIQHLYLSRHASDHIHLRVPRLQTGSTMGKRR